MKLYDFTHAYQPFQPPNFIPDWVEKNLRSIHLPLSRAMKEGVIKHHVQLQGWTIHAFLSSPQPIQDLAKRFLNNLQVAYRRGHIQLGFSGYSHPILPFLTDEVCIRSIQEDYQTIKKYLGKPSWFWFPEGTCDRRSLELLFQEFPNILAVIPDGCLGKKNFSGFYKLKEGGKIVICNSIFKDIFMNARDYGEPQPYTPTGLTQETAEKMITDPTSLNEGLRFFINKDFVVLARDLENAGSKYGLFEFKQGAKELESFYKDTKAVEFSLVGEQNSKRPLALENIQPSSWEPQATPQNPYPYWDLPAWKKFIDTFCQEYQEHWPRRALIALASDVPWHLLARSEWSPFPEHSIRFTEKTILPLAQELGSENLIQSTRQLLTHLRTYSHPSR